MVNDTTRPRYELTDVEPGYVIIEREMYSHAARSYFSAEPVPPKEPYREGSRVWSFWEMAQSFRFAVRDNQTGETVRFDEMLGLLYYGCCDKDSELYRIGELAHENRISIYVAVTYEAPDGGRLEMPLDKLVVLNKAFNERLRTRDKKILILPDSFGLYKELSYGQIMLDFGLTAMEEKVRSA
ncbi:MAG TPA: hypothetical protein VLW17_06250 [Thermoanaerobaculaceae bacterium]|nr:hypothetical protein [Thermoanaerobaculaceae bacterium]